MPSDRESLMSLSKETILSCSSDLFLEEKLSETTVPLLQYSKGKQTGISEAYLIPNILDFL